MPTDTELNFSSIYPVPNVVTSPPPPPPTLSAVVGNRNVTVVGQKLCWSDALLYCRCHYWDLLSLRSQAEQTEVEQLLSSSPFLLTDNVWLGMHRYNDFLRAALTNSCLSGLQSKLTTILYEMSQ